MVAAVGSIAAAVASCWEVVHGACLVSREEAPSVVVGSCQAEEAAPALAKKMLYSQH